MLFMNTRFSGSPPAAQTLTRFQLAELAFAPVSLAGWYTAMLWMFIGPRNATVSSSSNGARFPASTTYSDQY